jgi:Cu/Ag efflux protein CusF
MSGNENNKLNNNIFSQGFGFKSVNPFDAASASFTQNFNQIPKAQRRLNGYDSTILNKANFDQVQEPDLSMDFRIKEKETILKELDEKIKLSDNYGNQGESLSLKAKRQRIYQELNTLKKQQIYGSQGLSEDKFSHNTLKYKMPVLYKINDFVSRHILSKVSKKINSVVALSDSLEQLSDISKSVDELVGMNIPYGEKVQNYEKLTQYLSQANAIHTKISKTLRK